jgi:hypothetical protein
LFKSFRDEYVLEILMAGNRTSGDNMTPESAEEDDDGDDGMSLLLR